MLKSCKYCNRIHDSKFDCGKKPQRTYKRTEEDKFRWTKSWQNKREEIKERDNFLCQACIRRLTGTTYAYTYDELEVHHAEKLNKSYEKRVDNDNLLTLCSKHHKMADNGEISYDVVKSIIREQQSKGI
jgi:5-methylcytosine-specific restriction endonuclease McrA